MRAGIESNDGDMHKPVRASICAAWGNKGHLHLLTRARGLHLETVSHLRRVVGGRDDRSREKSAGRVGPAAEVPGEVEVGRDVICEARSKDTRAERTGEVKPSAMDFCDADSHPRVFVVLSL